ncbi:MAG: hypothetical protein LUB83_02560 [Prevotellaceae bacterium]|nr:hypothetical protein [Prevotellaceae bacterium]
MDFKHIEQLLSRYWQCETTLEEEAELRTFFNGPHVPQHLLRYKALFVYQRLLSEESGLDEAFDARVLARISGDTKTVVKAKPVKLTVRFVPLLKAAAIVAAIIAVGSLIEHPFFSTGGEEIAAAADTIGEQISAPSVALSGEVSTACGQELLDSLQGIQKEVENKE